MFNVASPLFEETAMKYEFLKYGLLLVDMVLMGINITLELRKRRGGK